ncbi:cyclic nucleotide-binding domain-containing protein [Sphingosinicella sp. LY1275]|uniref:cyclic nucleotide-binding domain-containing protein n=1 Tax=Sphingosinicella sp. LY1275 TaxID=3095379 RepID=UPI002ADEBF26|nr:cyclic nucleotide-binding domain-containing protein [Sphingosinicella sp. LY1275]MEA1013016.1 cyclic nucleotide-binding domain-containing protein [Sphingosinicella sp. LY1275]
MEVQGFWSEISWGDLIGQLPFLLLVIAMFRRQLHRLRAIVAAGALIGLFHALYWSGNVLLAIWWGLLLGATLILLGQRLYESSKVRFTPEEEEMLKGILAGLTRNRARHLLDQGFWLSGREGDTLTREDEAVSHLFYLAAGEARVMSQGRQVGLCRNGDLIGEVTVLSGDQASATVVLAGPARFWCAPASALRPYLVAHDDVRHALEQGFTASLRSKLRASNQRIAEAGGVTA